MESYKNRSLKIMIILILFAFNKLKITDNDFILEIKIYVGIFITLISKLICHVKMLIYDDN